MNKAGSSTFLLYHPWSVAFSLRLPRGHKVTPPALCPFLIQTNRRGRSGRECGGAERGGREGKEEVVDPIHKKSYNREIYRNRKYISGCQGLQGGGWRDGSVIAKGLGFFFFVR